MRNKKIKKTKAARSAKAKFRKVPRKQNVLVSETQLRQKTKLMTPMVVKTKALGVGHIYTNEPKVKVNIRGRLVEKVVVHLMKKRSPKDETLVPKIFGGKPLKTLCLPGNYEMLKAAMPIARARRSGATGISNRDYSKYEFLGQVFNKGRLCLAIVRKFVEEKNPTLDEIKSIFSEDTIRPYGQLFLLADDAKRANQTSARSRFFSKDEDIISINGASIAITNQIDSAVTGRMIEVAIGKLNYEIKPSVKQSSL